jgi:hypothetical protein
MVPRTNVAGRRERYVNLTFWDDRVKIGIPIPETTGGGALGAITAILSRFSACG